MPKRPFDDVNEGMPGDDDARYAGPLYHRTNSPLGTLFNNGEGSSTAAETSERPSNEDEESFIVTPEVAETLFKTVHGRILNTMQPLYQLPADEEEVKVSSASNCDDRH